MTSASSPADGFKIRSRGSCSGSGPHPKNPKGFAASVARARMETRRHRVPGIDDGNEGNLTFPVRERYPPRQQPGHIGERKGLVLGVQGPTSVNPRSPRELRFHCLKDRITDAGRA